MHPALTVTGLEPRGEEGVVVTEATVHNQRGELVLSGRHQYPLRRGWTPGRGSPAPVPRTALVGEVAGQGRTMNRGAIFR
ncbi:hypothetical protein ABZV75_11510 [Streptomyces flaveolus]|uniref:hypothetical protein n=1 Tax=Streptomyces flaveolus TaxID=67297 RepID=UPI0033AA0DDA